MRRDQLMQLLGGYVEDFTANLTPQKNIVVTEGQSLQFTIVVEGLPPGKYEWGLISPAGRYKVLPSLTTATVSIPFTLADDGSGVTVYGKTPLGANYARGTDPIKVLPK
jgi:hypothetical protein